MIKIILKHFIYEQCINVLFNQIVLNFSEVKRERVKLRGRKLRGRFLSLKYIDETDIMPTVHYNVREGTF